MSCAAYIVYTFHLSLHHANVGQFKVKPVVWVKNVPPNIFKHHNTVYSIFILVLKIFNYFSYFIRI